MTTLSAILWTHELSMSAKIIAEETAPQPGREYDAGEIRRRAAELYRNCQPGVPLTSIGVSLVQALRSRLHDAELVFIGAAPFERAWAAAYQAAKDEWPKIQAHAEKMRAAAAALEL